MSYVTPEPPLHAFPDPKQQSLIRRLKERIANLESATNLQGMTNGRVAPVPAKAKITVSSYSKVPGVFNVRLINPEHLGGNSNPMRAPIVHRLEASPYPDFTKDVTDFGISHQTYWSISELGSGTYYFRVSSSFDGKNFNQPQRSARVTA